MIYDELRHEGAFTRCFECDRVVENREGSRWIDSDRGRYLACTECAGGHEPGVVSEVERHPLMEEIASCENGIEEGRRLIRENSRRKSSMICEILDEEGYREGLVFYQPGGKKMIVTGRTRDHLDGDVRVLCHPARKDGKASMYNEEQMSWIDFVRIWRMQRVDPELYASRSEERFRKSNEEFHRKISEGEIKM